jgi:hypothetical protein
MRLPQLAATIWLQTSSRTVLNLVSTRRLIIQPFASQFALFSQVKSLHQSDAKVKSENDDSSTVDQPKLEAQKDAKTTKGEPGLAKDKDDYTATPR